MYYLLYTCPKNLNLIFPDFSCKVDLGLLDRFQCDWDQDQSETYSYTQDTGLHPSMYTCHAKTGKHETKSETKEECNKRLGLFLSFL